MTQIIGPPRRVIPPQILIYRSLAQDYSAIEVPDFYEAVSIRLIVMGLSELRRLIGTS